MTITYQNYICEEDKKRLHLGKLANSLFRIFYHPISYL